MAKFKKGDKLTIRDARKGKYLAVAGKAFDTAKDEWATVLLDQDQLDGQVNSWVRGEEVPCRTSLANIEKRK